MPISPHHFTFAPDTFSADPDTLVLSGPTPPDFIETESGRQQVGRWDPDTAERTSLGRIFNRRERFEGTVYGLDGFVACDTQEEAKWWVRGAAMMLYDGGESLVEEAA